ncbi:hypothetical protein Acsp06_59240 [Actinomycetospora sp. NBRC 106375]|uniref:hypothetical protein n=1 Tax=Actinomycetospora sp. NBRC 106375 TaxID=3032207 RepID=UPI0024A36165|nr:hypothetical protein [Actinomycetospora sp. NBRC 106375]GLZ49739.1 hypothetical protein Acsp06_59240 [Actinomycetospora sp. NBRC 106375]
MDEADGAARVSGMPRVQTVPDWVPRPLSTFSWMEQALLWAYVKRGKSPEVHGAQCALAWVGGVHPTAPATADTAAPSQWRAMGELIACGAVSRGGPYPEPQWRRDAGIARLDGAARRRWWGQWSSYGWTTAMTEGAGLALSWAMGFNDDTPPVLPRHSRSADPPATRSVRAGGLLLS